MMAATNCGYSLPIKATLAIEKKLLITTTTKLITLRYTGLQWVSVLLLYDIIFLYFTSITSTAQAQLFQESRMGARVD